MLAWSVLVRSTGTSSTNLVASGGIVVQESVIGNVHRRASVVEDVLVDIVVHFSELVSGENIGLVGPVGIFDVVDLRSD